MKSAEDHLKTSINTIHFGVSGLMQESKQMRHDFHCSPIIQMIEVRTERGMAMRL